MFRFFNIVLCWLLCGLIQVAAAQERLRDVVAPLAAKLEPAKKLVYKTGVGPKLSLHVFEPPGWTANDQRPCLILFHGGGWAGGNARRMYPYAAHFAKLGMVGICADYRLLELPRGTTVFESVMDARSAVRYVRANAKSLGVDPTKVVASGASAGGHLAVGTALFETVNDTNDVAEISAKPNALVLLYPVIDTSSAGYGNAKIGERWQELSPAHQVHGSVPPTLIFHGTGDTVTPFAGVEIFRAAMLKQGNRCDLDVHEGGRHGYLIFDEKLYADTLAKMEQFFVSLELLPKAK